ncbi:hypothetical protein L596_029147 [Steinernema carpocapsae]|uniref:Major facilitator superfamily (MFS) profile domain-containing protein n=1 Tax=Steinernema carpocapsae TaxID=34508 RepID=A0A4U5LTT2_STECR|nr:hypothetical protein L596_029147 [Steinernema carpocapsae]
MIRYVVLAITLVAMSVLLANTVLFNFTVICMKAENRHKEMSYVNETTEARFYSPAEEGWIIAAPSVGLITGTLPAIYFSQKRGLRQAFTFFGLCSGMATLAYPFLIQNLPVSLVLRFIQGFAVACAFVAIGVVPIEYGGESEKGLFVAVLTATYQLGPFSTIPASALFCSSSIGWKGVYFLFGGVTIVSAALFFIFYRNSANKNRTLSRARILPLMTDEQLKAAKKKKIIPYKKIFCTQSVWGLLNSGIGDSVGYLVFFLYGPIYVNKVSVVLSEYSRSRFQVLKFGVKITGLLAAIPYVVASGTKLFAGFFIHKSSLLNSSKGVKWSTFVSLTLVAALFIVQALIGAEMPLVAEVLLTLNVASAGFHFIGLMAAAQTVAQQHTQVLSSSIAAIESFFGLILPPIVSYMAPDHTAEQWAIIFYAVAGILILTNVLFFFMTKVEAADWTKKDEDKKVVYYTQTDSACV